MIHSDNTELSEQKPYGSYVSVVLFFVICLLPCVGFLAKYGGQRGAIWIYVAMLGGSGLLSTILISLLANKLKRYRNIGHALTFLILGAIVGVGANIFVHIGISATLIFGVGLPLSAFFNSLIATFIFSIVALVIGLLIGCFCLPKTPDDEYE